MHIFQWSWNQLIHCILWTILSTERKYAKDVPNKSHGFKTPDKSSFPVYQFNFYIFTKKSAAEVNIEVLLKLDGDVLLKLNAY